MINGKRYLFRQYSYKAWSRFYHKFACMLLNSSILYIYTSFGRYVSYSVFLIVKI